MANLGKAVENQEIHDLVVPQGLDGTSFWPSLGWSGPSFTGGIVPHPWLAPAPAQSCPVCTGSSVNGKILSLALHQGQPHDGDRTVPNQATGDADGGAGESLALSVVSMVHSVSRLGFGSCSPAFLGSAGGRPAGSCSASTCPLPFRPSWCTLRTLKVWGGSPSSCVLAREFRGLARRTGVQPLSVWSWHSQSGCPASPSLAAVPGAVWLRPAAPRWHLETTMLQP